MSAKYMGMVWDLAIPHAQAWVLMAYADHCDHRGEHIRPGVNLIVHKTGYSRRQVQIITAQLIAAHLLIVVQQGGGRGLATEYRIDLQAVARKSEGDQDVNSAETAPNPIKNSAETAPFPGETAQSEGQNRAETAQKPRRNRAVISQNSAIISQNGALASAPQPFPLNPPTHQPTNPPPEEGGGVGEGTLEAGTDAPFAPLAPDPQGDDAERIVTLLCDPAVGLSPVVAARVADTHTFAAVLAHVMAWRRERSSRMLGAGALAWRLETGRPPPDLTPADLVDDLYVRHMFAGDRDRAEAEARHGRYLPAEYAGLIMH